MSCEVKISPEVAVSVSRKMSVGLAAKLLSPEGRSGAADGGFWSDGKRKE